MADWRRSLVHLMMVTGASVAVAGACGEKHGDAGEQPPAPAAVDHDGVQVGEVPEAATRVGAPERLLTYLEPEATGVLYLDLPPGLNQLDAELVSTVFALPPRGRDLLVAALGVDPALSAVLGPDGPAPSELMGAQTLVVTPAVATGVYVLRPLIKSPSEVEAILTAQAMERGESDGVAMLSPRGAFPYKAALLEGDVIAFIPRSEIGSGLGPLTAGRDLPASELRNELSGMLKADPTVVLVAVVAGPMLHLDLSDDVALARLILRSWQGGGLDAEIRMQTTGEAELAAGELEKRTAPLETDQVQALIERVAFTVDGPTVAGRLQLTRDDLVQLEKRP